MKLLSKFTSHDWAAIVGAVASMGTGLFLGLPFWVAFALGIVGSIVLSVAWSIVVHWRDLVKTYKKALDDYDREHGNK